MELRTIAIRIETFYIEACIWNSHPPPFQLSPIKEAHPVPVIYRIATALVQVVDSASCVIWIALVTCLCSLGTTQHDHQTQALGRPRAEFETRARGHPAWWAHKGKSKVHYRRGGASGGCFNRLVHTHDPTVAEAIRDAQGRSSRAQRKCETAAPFDCAREVSNAPRRD